MKNLMMVALFVAVACFSALAHGLDASPWIGDGLPEREGAAWYREDRAPEFVAGFVAPEGAREVEVKFAVAGFGSFSVNGVPCMAEDGLDTLWSVYGKTVYFFKAKVPVRPRPEINRLCVQLGNGFYNFFPLKFWGSKCFREKLAHGRPCFKLAVEGVALPLDGWKWRKTNIRRNSVYLGAEVDATLPEDDEWKAAAKVAGPGGKLREWARTNPQMITDGVYAGVSRWRKGGSVQVVDFGANASGVPVFRFSEKRGTVIEIVYGERLNADGSVNPLTQSAGQVKRPGMGGEGAPDLACQRDLFIASGKGWEEFSPKFTWHVCRYAEVRGATRLLGEGDAAFKVRSMLSLSRSNAEAAKRFKPDGRDIAAIHELCRRTFQANLVGGVQSDCPGRERLGYGGDIVATFEAHMLNFDMREIYLKILRDFADEAEDDGWITETAPYVGVADNGYGGRSGPISWALAVPELMNGILRHYDDRRALDFYPVCARYVRLLNAKYPDGIVPTCIGDHEALERVSNECIATAHWHRFVELTSSFAGRLERKDEQKEFEAVAAKIRSAFVSKFVKDGIVDNGTQSAQATGLYLGLVPPEQRRAALSRLVAAVEEKGCAPSTGIFSTRYMLMYLSENGHLDLARRIVLHRGFPGWLYMLERGATTLWETWAESDDVYSNCHPMFGSVDEWILKYVGDRNRLVE